MKTISEYWNIKLTVLTIRKIDFFLIYDFNPLNIVYFWKETEPTFIFILSSFILIKIICVQIIYLIKIDFFQQKIECNVINNKLFFNIQNFKDNKFVFSYKKSFISNLQFFKIYLFLWTHIYTADYSI